MWIEGLSAVPIFPLRYFFEITTPDRISLTL